MPRNQVFQCEWEKIAARYAVNETLDLPVWQTLKRSAAFHLAKVAQGIPVGYVDRVRCLRKVLRWTYGGPLIETGWAP